MVKYDEFNLFKIKLYTLKGAKLLSLLSDIEMKYNFMVNSNVAKTYQSHRLRNVRMLKRNSIYTDEIINKHLTANRSNSEYVRKEFSPQLLFNEINKCKIELNITGKPFLKLNNYYLIIESSFDSLNSSEVLFVEGKTGVGKTVNLINFSKNNIETFKYLRLYKSMSDLIILQEIAKLFSLKIIAKNIDNQVDMLVDFIKSENKKVSLIIDNALIMKSKIVAEDIFYIREASNNLLNLIFVGSANLRKGFRKILDNEKYSSVYLSELTSEEVHQVCNNFNITSRTTIEKRFVSVKNIAELLQKIKAYKSSKKNGQNYG